MSHVVNLFTNLLTCSQGKTKKHYTKTDCIFLALQDLAVKTANENGSTLILANDPDADRLGAAEKQTEYVG